MKKTLIALSALLTMAAGFALPVFANHCCGAEAPCCKEQAACCKDDHQ